MDPRPHEPHSARPVGIAVRGVAPAVADRIAPFLARAGTAGLIIVVLFALAKLYPALLNTAPLSYLVIALISMAALAIAIASANFGPERALPVLVPCVITFIVIATVYLSWRARGTAAAEMRTA